MKYLYLFECTFDQNLSESPSFKELYGPIVKEDKRIAWIENHAENDSIFHNVGLGKGYLGKALFKSPYDVVHVKELIPHFDSFPVDDTEIGHVYMLAFFFNDVDKDTIMLIQAIKNVEKHV